MREMFRTRFKRQIVAEFQPSTRARIRQKLIILCDGMPSIPRKQPLLEFLAHEGFWVIYPRYRGAWESEGEFLRLSPHQDILDIIDELPGEIEEIVFGRRFQLSPSRIFVIGGSFGGTTAILASLDSRIDRAGASCPVVDWSILARSEPLETSKTNYAAYIREAFGSGYRLSDENWAKLRSGSFFSPWHRRREISAAKLLLVHAKDDPYAPYRRTRRFAEITGAKLRSLRRGGHISTESIVRRYWPEIKTFFHTARDEQAERGQPE
jgi:pimeloyl-ACP methyl ester carboxylesterase